jgi:hypothetical protein
VVLASLCASRCLASPQPASLASSRSSSVGNAQPSSSTPCYLLSPDAADDDDETTAPPPPHTAQSAEAASILRRVLARPHARLFAALRREPSSHRLHPHVRAWARARCRGGRVGPAPARPPVRCSAESSSQPPGPPSAERAQMPRLPRPEGGLSAAAEAVAESAASQPRCNTREDGPASAGPQGSTGEAKALLQLQQQQRVSEQA